MGSNKRWRKKNPERAKEAAVRQRAKRRAAIDAIKLASGCVDCGYDTSPLALHFDHVNGEKMFSIGTGYQREWSVVLEEIVKCEVRCANCHAIRTWG